MLISLGPQNERYNEVAVYTHHRSSIERYCWFVWHVITDAGKKGKTSICMPVGILVYQYLFADASGTTSRRRYSSPAPGCSLQDHIPDPSYRISSQWLSTRSGSCWRPYHARRRRWTFCPARLSTEESSHHAISTDIICQTIIQHCRTSDLELTATCCVKLQLSIFKSRHKTNLFSTAFC